MGYIIFKVIDVNSYQINIFFINSTKTNMVFFSFFKDIIDTINEWFISNEQNSYLYEINLNNNLEYTDVYKFTQIEFSNYSYHIINKNIFYFDYSSYNKNIKDKYKCEYLYNTLGFDNITTFFSQSMSKSPSTSFYSEDFTDSDYDNECDISTSTTNFFKIVIDENIKNYPKILNKFI